MNSRIILVVQLFIHADREAEFRQFETETARIMSHYDGHVETVIRPLDCGQSSGQADALPYEVHLVSFPSLEQFEAYREDSDLATLATLRQSAIARTEILIGRAIAPYY
jgi:antibiotic biosynthesis monooxygenase (ABM) superfamily enzyme